MSQPSVQETKYTIDFIFRERELAELEARTNELKDLERKQQERRRLERWANFRIYFTP